MNVIFDKIVTTKPREKAGSRAYNRFNFQQDWALCKILQTYSQADDFLACFDYHEDFVLLDSANDPQKISFYQIKTKQDGTWKLTSLIHAKKGKTGKQLNSFLGKLYYNYISFKNTADKIYFVSNAKYNITLRDTSNSTTKERIKGHDICIEECKMVNEALVKELNLEAIPSFEDITIFEVTTLTIDHHEEITKTQLADFLEKEFPNTNYQLMPIYKTIFGEIKRKASYENNISNLKTLLLHKSISKQQFKEYLRVTLLQKRDSFKEKCDRIELRLNSENEYYSQIKKYRDNFFSIEIDMMDKNNVLFDKLRHVIRNIIEQHKAELEVVELKHSVDIIYNHYQVLGIKQNSYREDYIKTLILIELYEI
jgi:hypothetical protein